MAVANALNLEQIHPAVRALLLQVGSTTSSFGLGTKSARTWLAQRIEDRMSSHDVDAAVRCAQEWVDAERGIFDEDRLRYNATAREKYHGKERKDGESKLNRRSPAERAVRADWALVAVANALNLDASLAASALPEKF